MDVTEADLETLSREIVERAAVRGRWLLGIAGAPGSGKSTVAAELAQRLGDACVIVPMDGFHLPRAALSAAQVARRGAPDTFDGAAFVAMLERIRDGHDVRAPAFDHDLGDPVPDAIEVPSDVPVVIVEGNYLLLDEPPWLAVRPLLDEAWLVVLDRAVRQQRLAARHQRGGKPRHEALRFATVSDEANAQRIAISMTRPDRVLQRG